jgi:hypothetical protein
MTYRCTREETRGASQKIKLLQQVEVSFNLLLVLLLVVVRRVSSSSSS